MGKDDNIYWTTISVYIFLYFESLHILLDTAGTVRGKDVISNHLIEDYPLSFLKLELILHNDFMMLLSHGPGRRFRDLFEINFHALRTGSGTFPCFEHCAPDTPNSKPFFPWILMHYHSLINYLIKHPTVCIGSTRSTENRPDPASHPTDPPTSSHQCYNSHGSPAYNPTRANDSHDCFTARGSPVYITRPVPPEASPTTDESRSPPRLPRVPGDIVFWIDNLPPTEITMTYNNESFLFTRT